MQVKEFIEKLENHPEFKEWKKKNQKSYLAHLFKMVDNLNKGIWQIGYYNEDGTITTFIIEDKDIKIIPEQEIFQKKKRKVHKIDLSKVKLDVDKALEIAKDFQTKNLSGNEPTKIMLILQNIADNNIYNITYITKSFNTLNMKIDAITGKIISHEITPMMQFKGKAG